jgi:putative nucleotidyltransferase with HDIG domain
MSESRHIDYLLEEVVTLPSLPVTVAHITEMINDPNCSLAEVGRAISADPAIALKTLRLVNSAYYGMSQKVTSVEHAVVLLGLKVIKNLVFTATVFETLQGGIDTFLRHSISTGVAMRILSGSGKHALPLETPDEAFVYGLLHDIGKIVFEEFLPKEFERVADLSVTQGVPWFEAERQVIGVDHAEMGSRLAEKWRLPGDLVNAIAGHHDVSQCRDGKSRSLAALLAIADYMVSAAGIVAYPRTEVVIREEMWETAGFTGADMKPLIDEFFQSFNTIEELMSLAA